MKKIDFTNCKVVLNYTYEGANGKKIAIMYGDDIYMLKFPSVSKNNNKISYSNSVISEYISCEIYRMLGFKTQEVIFGTYNTGKKEKDVVACKDFTISNKKFHCFASIKNTIIDSESNGFGTDLSEVIDTIYSQTIIDSEYLLKYFWEMFIVDSLLGNFDRHNGNCGFLSDEKGNFEIAPIFDCGSCLFPAADDELIKQQLNNYSELEKRIYTFPNSAIKIDGVKINPYKYINSLSNENCNKALLKIYPKIDIQKINKIIEDVPISDLRKEYYKKIIFERYDKILTPAYNSLNRESF